MKRLVNHGVGKKKELVFKQSQEIFSTNKQVNVLPVDSLG